MSGPGPGLGPGVRGAGVGAPRKTRSRGRCWRGGGVRPQRRASVSSWSAVSTCRHLTGPAIPTQREPSRSHTSWREGRFPREKFARIWAACCSVGNDSRAPWGDCPAAIRMMTSESGYAGCSSRFMLRAVSIAMALSLVCVGSMGPRRTRGEVSEAAICPCAKRLIVRLRTSLADSWGRWIIAPGTWTEGGRFGKAAESMHSISVLVTVAPSPVGEC